MRMYYGQYNRLGVHIFASNLEVIKAASKMLKDKFNKAEREARREFYRSVLELHKDAQDLAIRYRL